MALAMASAGYSAPASRPLLPHDPERVGPYRLEAVLGQGAQLLVVSCDYDMGAGAATVGNDAKIPTMSLCASDAKMGVQGIGPYAFTMANTSLSFGASLAQWGTEVKKFKTAYLLLDTSIEYPKGICAGFKEQWEKDGTVVGEDTFKQDDPSIASQISAGMRLRRSRMGESCSEPRRHSDGSDTGIFRSSIAGTGAAIATGADMGAGAETGSFMVLSSSASWNSLIVCQRLPGFTERAFIRAASAFLGILTPRLEGGSKVSSCKRSRAAGGTWPVIAR